MNTENNEINNSNEEIPAVGVIPEGESEIIEEIQEPLITRNLESKYDSTHDTSWVKIPKRSGLASGLMWGIIIGALMVGSMWYYLHKNTYNYQLQNNTSVLSKPRDIQELLATIEPATVAISIGGGAESIGGGAGTGFIYSEDGFVVTNNHVIEGDTKTIVVTLSDGRALNATLLGRDPVEDLAVLQIEGSDFPFAKLGSSDELKVGDDVVAIGNALALEGGLSVTRGIVSGKDRTIDTELGTQLQGIIQTDAAINRGNSGGPLVNSKGEVIAINTAIADPSYAQNVGFAIPIDRAKPIIEDLKKGVDRKVAFVGIQAQDVSSRLVKELDLKVSVGALVVAISPDSPASDTDIQKNDVLTEIDGVKVETSADMVREIRSKKPGDKVTIKYNRDGSEKSVEVTLAERPA